MDHDIGAQRQRLLQRRRAEAIVHRQQRAGLSGHRGKRRNIVNLGQRIGWRLDVQHAGCRRHRRLPCRRFGARHKSGFDAESLHDRAKKLHRGAEHPRGTHDVVAAFEQAHDTGQNGRHAGRGRDAALRALERRQALLECRHRRVGEARIDIARLLVGKPRRRRRRGFEYEARCQVHRLRMLAELAAFDPGAYRQSFQLVLFVHIRHQYSDVKKPVSAFAKNGFALALAVFIKRPQADSQIGAGTKLLRPQYVVKLSISPPSPARGRAGLRPAPPGFRHRGAWTRRCPGIPGSHRR